MWFCYGWAVESTKIDCKYKTRTMIIPESSEKHENSVFQKFLLHIAFSKSCVFGDPFNRVDVRSIHKEMVHYEFHYLCLKNGISLKL